MQLSASAKAGSHTQFAMLDGNEAIAQVAYALNEVITIYPFKETPPMQEYTPQSFRWKPLKWWTLSLLALALALLISGSFVPALASPNEQASALSPSLGLGPRYSPAMALIL